MYYINYFFLFSIIGHLLETFVYENRESGVMSSYWTPIYGIGTVIIIFLYNYINKKWSLNKVTKFFIVFLVGTIILSILELIGGYLIEWIFNITFWDYSSYSFNIGKYASLEMSLIWGLSSILLIYFLKPICDKIVKIIPRILTKSLIVIFIIDLFHTLNL